MSEQKQKQPKSEKEKQSQEKREAEAREARGQKHLEAARKAHYASTGEPSKAPDHDDAVRERAITASKGSKSSKKK